MEKHERNYKLPDAVLLEVAERMNTSLVQHIDDFTTFDTTFGNTYPAELTAALQEISTIDTDQVVIDQMAELTEKLDQAMASCNKAFRTIAFFVKKAFPDSAAKQNQFGLNDMRKARQSQANLVLFMENLARQVEAHKDKLIEQGCNEQLINGLPTLAQELKTANVEQEVFKKERGLITQERIEKMNNLYRLMKPIHDIARIVYADDPALLDTFTIPAPKSSVNTEEDLVVS